MCVCCVWGYKSIISGRDSFGVFYEVLGNGLVIVPREIFLRAVSWFWGLFDVTALRGKFNTFWKLFMKVDL